MATDKKATKRHRSPAYPSISLSDAVNKAEKLYAEEKLNEFDPEVALEHWGYEPGSANGMRAIAALKQYGLLSEERGDGDRSLRLNDLAVDLLLPEEEDSSEHRRAMQDAALNPTLFQEIWDRHKKDGLPSDRNLERYLIKDKKFNPAAVRPVIRIFRDTLAYAGLSDAATMDDPEAGEELPKPKKTPAFNPSIFDPIKPPTSPQPPGGEGIQMRDLPITLPSLNVAVLRVPAVMNEQDFIVLETALKSFKPALVPKQSGTQAKIDDDDLEEEDEYEEDGDEDEV